MQMSKKKLLRLLIESRQQMSGSDSRKSADQGDNYDTIETPGTTSGYQELKMSTRGLEVALN